MLPEIKPRAVKRSEKDMNEFINCLNNCFTDLLYKLFWVLFATATAFANVYFGLRNTEICPGFYSNYYSNIIKFAFVTRGTIHLGGFWYVCLGNASRFWVKFQEIPGSQFSESTLFSLRLVACTFQV